MTTLEKRLTKLETRQIGTVAWPDAFERPASPIEQARFDRRIAARRERGQKCFIWPTEEFPTEDAAWGALAECFIA